MWSMATSLVLVRKVLDQWFSTFLTRDPLIQFLVLRWPPTIKLLHCYFITVILLLLWIVMRISQMQVIWYATPVKGPFDPLPQRCHDLQVENHCSRWTFFVRNDVCCATVKMCGACKREKNLQSRFWGQWGQKWVWHSSYWWQESDCAFIHLSSPSSPSQEHLLDSASWVRQTWSLLSGSLCSK